MPKLPKSSDLPLLAGTSAAPTLATIREGDIGALVVDARFAFDAYLMVDWSANSTPKRGADSLWWALVVRTAYGLRLAATFNPTTRDEASREVRATLVHLVGARASVLVGFDFPYAAPRGLAAALNLQGTPWSALWKLLADNITDEQARGRNNRFAFASTLNARLHGRGPFWGCPTSQATPHLGSKGVAPAPLQAKRVTELAARGAKSVWQLFGQGTVGSQTLLGVPRVRALRHDRELAPHSQVWPFETGPSLPERTAGAPRVVHAEIYPSIERVEAVRGQVKDEAQVIGQALAFARRDEEGTLAELFAEPAKLAKPDLDAVVEQEGWILGVRTKA